MVPNDPRQTALKNNDVSLRRHFLGHAAALSAIAMLWPVASDAAMELWEEGDPLCKVAYHALDKPDGYELDIAYLESFISISESLTGVNRLDQYLANEYMERYATHPQLSKNLDLLIKAWRNLTVTPTEDHIKQNIMASPDAVVRAGAKQLMYLWYISAFYIPLDITLGPKPPLRDDPADTRKKVWVYGTPEQYERGLIWSVIHAHAPMTPGGPRRYWANEPKI